MICVLFTLRALAAVTTAQLLGVNGQLRVLRGTHKNQLLGQQFKSEKQGRIKRKTQTKSERLRKYAKEIKKKTSREMTTKGNGD